MRLRSPIGLMLALLLLALPILACASRPPSQSAPRQDPVSITQFDGVARSYIVHTPSGYSASRPAPVILAFHGAGGTAAGMEALTHLNTVADQDGFLAVYPEGVNHLWSYGKAAALGGVDDVGFITALLDTLAHEYAIDRARVYATGISNGGFFAALLACQRADRIAAVAQVGSTMAIAQAATCAPSRPMPALLFNGTADPIIPYQGTNEGVASLLSAPATTARWAALAGCAPTPTDTMLPATVEDGTAVTSHTYNACAQGASVVLYEITGGGHTWPGGLQYAPVANVGKTTGNLDADSVMWTFFQAHPLR